MNKKLKGRDLVISIGLIIIISLSFLWLISTLTIMGGSVDRNTTIPSSMKSSVENATASLPNNFQIQDYQLNKNILFYNESALVDQAVYKVTKVVDGDTIKAEQDGKEYKVRLIGIDTPELNSNDCYSKQAKQYLSSIVSSQEIYLVNDETQADEDKYGRLLRYVVLVDGTIVNYSMVISGHAQEYTYSNTYKFQTEFKKAESNARSVEVGIFGESCACSERQGQEVSRSCNGCKTARIKLKQSDCTNLAKTVEDSSCTAACPKPTPTTPTFTCNCSKTCSQITTCTEAYYLLNQCGCSARDGDNDGIPCEAMCG